MADRTYTASVVFPNGHPRHTTEPHPTREAAVRAAFIACPGARSCSSCYGYGFDIRWHARSEEMPSPIDGAPRQSRATYHSF